MSYATIASRRTYGGSTRATIAKEVAIGLLYIVAGGIAMLATIYWVALFS